MEGGSEKEICRARKRKGGRGGGREGKQRNIITDREEGQGRQHSPTPPLPHHSFELQSKNKQPLM